MKEYWKKQFPPFRLADDLCYVGTDKGPSYLLERSDGLVLIDTGFPQTVYLLLENIWALGYNPYEIWNVIL